MTVHERATIIPLPHRDPHVPPSALVMPGAVIAGAVSLGERVGIWPGASLRAEEEPVTIGDDSNVQDSCSLHVDKGSPLTIGARVSIGHNAVVHGCTVEDDVLIGGNCGVFEGTIVRTGAVLAPGTMLSAGTPVFDLVRDRVYRKSGDRPLEIPAGAVVVPGTRPVASAPTSAPGIALYAPVIVKYRDEKTETAVRLENLLR